MVTVRSKKSKNLSFFCIIGLITYLVIRQKDESQEASIKASQPKRERILSSHKRMTPKAKKKNTRRIEKSIKLNSYGIRFVPKKIRNDQVILDILYQPKNLSCQKGELSSLARVTSSLDRKDFLLGVVIPGSKGKGTYQRLSLKQLQSQQDIRFKLPSSKTPQLVGLVLCSDKARTGTCKGKKQINFRKQPVSTQKQPKDYVFLTHKILADKRYLAVFNPKTSNQSHRTENFIKRRVKKTAMPASYKKLLQHERQLRNVPLQKQGHRLLVSLTQGDLSCLNKNKGRRYATRR